MRRIYVVFMSYYVIFSAFLKGYLTKGTFMKEGNRSRFLAIILTVAMVASLLAGCGDSAAD